uniref:Uncharacterized protein n=1 Tax=Cacopsylla melanoneura TaxID=428564 RepID=A0A8D8XKD8_9HEMI
MREGRPLLPTNLSRHAKNASVDNDDTNSMCTAVVLMHTKMQNQALAKGELRLGPVFNVNGPPRSTHTLIKARPCAKRDLGRSAIYGCTNLAFALKHEMHLNITLRINERAPTIQNIR